MTFRTPEAWWLLLGAVPLVVLHLRRRRRALVEVSSLRIWREVFGATAGRRGLRWLRETGALAILLLALVCLTASLADPVTGRAASPSQELVIVVDVSRSMAAQAPEAFPSGLGPWSRCHVAKQSAGAALARLGPADVVTVWMADRSPWVRIGPTRDHRAAAREMEEWFPRPGRHAGTLPETLDLIRGAARLSGRRTRVLVLTDSVGAASLPPELAGDATIGVVGAERPVGANAGIDAVRVEDGQVVVRMSHSGVGLTPRKLMLRGRFGRTVGEGPFLDFHPDRELEARIAVPAGVRGLVIATLHPPDDFPLDDTMPIMIRSRPPLRVAVLADASGASPYLVEALRSLPELVDAERALLLGPGAPQDLVEGVDVLIDTRGVGATAGSRPLLQFPAPGESVSQPVLWAVGDHPIVAGLDLSALRLDACNVLEPQNGEQALIRSSAGAVAVAGVVDGRRVVRVGFSPEATTLPLEAAFPLLVRNALEWLRGEPLLPAAVMAGDPLPLAGRLGPDVARVELAWAGRGADARVDGSAIVDVTPDAVDPIAPLPGANPELIVRAPGLRTPLARTAIQWRLPDDALLDAPTSAPDADAAIAALPDRSGDVGDERTWASLFAAAAALLLALGGMLLAPRRAGGPAAAPALPATV